MRENLSFVDRLHRDLREVRWAEPAEIRARARRRSRRTATLAAAAVLAVLSGSAYAVAGRSETPAPPIAATPVWTAAPGRAEIPQEALLSPGDVRLKTGVRLGEAGLGETVRVDPVLESCGRERGVPATAVTSRSSRSQTLLRPAADRSALSGPVLSQDVYRVDPGHGQLLFGTVTLLLRACAEWQLAGTMPLKGGMVPTVNTHRWELSDSRFAGDESVMLRHRSLAPRSRAAGKTTEPTPPVEVTMVVRVGDLVTVIATGPGTVKDAVEDAPPDSGLSYPELETLGRTAAGRLCVAANPRC
ncbi:hypothetical protein [Micromonospora sp. NPDC050200]|uniref:hypothetical protein n=1 Tax=Micromonospora sp. NPDC050200 TaxID=3155664 RepID=UPI0033E9855E